MRETHRKVARTVSNVLALMDEDPDFTYAMSSAQQYAWMEQEHPDLFARMLQRIKEGRFIPVGGMWVESDNMLPTGESLIRQITFGMRYFREHLVFIIVFNWGVVGAAIATVVGQIFSSILGTYLVFGNHTQVHISKKIFHLEKSLCVKIISCGFAFWVAQMAMGFISLVYNSQLGKYGGDIPN